MRILVDVPQEQLEALNVIAARRGTSRAKLVREAVDSYISEHRRPIESYFGIWKDNPETQDVRAYLDRIKDEWEERFPTPPPPES